MKSQVIASACISFLACLRLIAGQGVEGPTTLIYSIGEKGDPGEKGFAGSTGDNGIKGDMGVVGATGVPGNSGFKGSKGDVGIDGVNREGADGIVGVPGTEGATGATGQKGNQGISGDRGVRGERGNPGADGTLGERGETGEPGLTGSPGPQGASGQKGVQGDEGEKGDRGPRGPAGSQGPRGPPGESLDDVISAAVKCGPSFRCTGASSCTDTVTGPVCTCDPGYRIEDGQSTNCVDVDECMSSNCAHSCQNTEGSYRCTCLPGHSLADDGRSCQIDSSQCSCASDENCVTIASGPQCLPTTILMADGENAAALSLQYRSSEDITIEQTIWLNENWVIVLIIWGLVLTLVVILLAIWLTYESRQQPVAPASVEYVDMTHAAYGYATPYLAPQRPYSKVQYLDAGYDKGRMYELPYGNYDGNMVYR